MIEFKNSADVNKKVLIVDDDEGLRDSLKLRFQIAGFNTIAVESGDLAIEVVKDNDFLLVLSDIAMPDMDGFELFKALKELKPSLPVILMTAFGYDPNHTIIKASKLGLHKWIAKPIKDEVLEDIYRTATMFYDMRESE